MLALLYLFIFYIILFKSPFFNYKNIHKSEIIIAFTIKVVASIIFYLIYTEYYTVRKEIDMFRYYDDALIMHEAVNNNTVDYLKMLTGINDNSNIITENYYLRMDNWFESFETFIKNDNRTMIRLNALFLLISNNEIFVHKLFFLILGFIGSLWLLKTFESDNDRKNKILFYLVLFFPSLLFWTSSITKETILLFVLGGFMFFSKKYIQSKQSKFLLFAIIFLYFMTYIKVYAFFVLVPILLARLIFKNTSTLKRYIGYASIISIYLFFIWNFHHISPNHNFVQAFIRKQADFIHYAQFIGAGSLINMQTLEPNILSFMSATPMAIVNVLFRPFIWECSSIMMYPAAIENFIIILLIIIMLFYFNKKDITKHLFLISLFFCILFFILVGIGTPVLGAIVRYKIIGYPFLFFALLTCINIEKIPYFKNKQHNSSSHKIF